MKIGMIIPVFNEPALSVAMYEHYKDKVDAILFAVGEKPYFGEEEQDNTYKILKEKGAYVIKGKWSLDNLQRNVGIQAMQTFDWIITADSDEFMIESEWSALMTFLSETTAPAITVNQRPYLKDWNHVIIDDRWKPVFAVRPQVRFTHIRNINAPTDHCDVVYEHLSWCPPKDIRKKILTYAHADRFEEKWMDVYEKWNGEGTIVFPDGELNVIKHELDDEVKRLFKEE